MAALTSGKSGSVREVTRDKRPLAANAKVFKGGLAVCNLSGANRGFYQQAVAAGPGQVVVGRWYEDADNTGGANGAISADLHFLRERHLHLLANDGGTAVVAADRESPCQVLDDQTVTGASGNARAGLVYDVTTEGVWVEHQGTDLPAKVQTGTATLVGGTVTVTGVALTSKSVITMSHKTVGGTAGVLTAPAASRNTSTGQFVITSVSGTDTSTVDWVITG
jgi:hypothetical protein